MINGTEQCDDGNKLDNDECFSNCTLIPAITQTKKSQDAITSIQTVGVFASQAGQVATFLVLGPSTFIVLHQQEILRTSTLIGNISNDKMVSILTASINPFNQLAFLSKYVPTIKIGDFILMPEFADQRIKISGFPLYTTFFVLGILFV